MALDTHDKAIGRLPEMTATAAPPPAPARPAPAPTQRAALSAPSRSARLLRRGRRLKRALSVSPLTRRILLLNMIALGILVLGLAYLGTYQRNLIESQFESLTTQARIFAGALGESAVAGKDETSFELEPDQTRILLRRLIEPTKARARLFAPDGNLLADSRVLAAPGGAVQIVPLPPPASVSPIGRALEDAYDWFVDNVPRLGKLARYHESAVEHASDYPEAIKALAGSTARALYSNGSHGTILSVAVPVQHYKRVVGALVVSEESTEIDNVMRSVRLDILKAFAVALLVTTLLSLYLGSTIVHPIRRLAQAAERIGPGKGSAADIPDFTQRGDEIGDLSGSLREMTELLSQRMDAIERFAADVAHEIKNPLSSLRSAVETASMVKDPERQRRLMTIILEDVQRLDRLISDISSASRLDAELARAEAEPIDLASLLAALVVVYNADAAPDGPQLAFTGSSEALPVRGLEGRLAQVFRNLIENAISFSPQGGTISLSVRREGETVATSVEDDGPGLPEGKLEAVFERFYTERPPGEKFGVHSGLGLSISKQIVDAHGGTIQAENRHDAAGRILGARFTVRLPLERAIPGGAAPA
ncbi:MAG TPA: stimulus-sensing domain-containing protein [Alphaproteobacteria bacterium]|nr:stimulus-sensing domain-containing protein [Alphaproteobacteria bacterium]